MAEKSIVNPPQKIGQFSYLLADAGVAVSFPRSLPSDFDRGTVRPVVPPGGKETVEIMFWGSDNNLPQMREALICDNNIVPALIARKRDIVVGGGLKAVRRRVEKGKEITEDVDMPSEVADFLESANVSKYLLDAAGELMKHSHLVTEFSRGSGVMRQKIVGLTGHENKNLRAGKKDSNGNIHTWYWSGFWGEKNRSQGSNVDRKTIVLPVYDSKSLQSRFVTATGDRLLNDGYYPIPTWWGGWEWIELANSIPQFHRANLQNGYNIRWHIEMPFDYFLDYAAWSAATTEAEKATVEESAKSKEQQFIDDVNAFFAGLNNTGRTLFTKFELDKALGKEYPGIKITALNYDMQDEALLALFEKSNVANISAQAIHPTLANIETAGKLSSGTEIRNAFLMYLITSTPQWRRMLLDWVPIVRRANGWPTDFDFAFRDFELAALSDSKSGVKPSETQAGQPQ